MPVACSSWLAANVEFMSHAAALFFARGHLLQGLEAHRERLAEEIEEAPEEHVLKVDEQQWASALGERYHVDAPVLDRDGVRMEKLRAVQVDVSGDTSRIIRFPPTYRPGHETTVHIPFSGDPGVFQFLPSSHILVELHAHVGEGELLVDVAYPDDRPLDTTAYADKFIDRIEINLESARADIAKFNSELDSFALATITARLERMQKHSAYVAATGLPIIDEPSAPKVSIPDAITRRAAPPLLSMREDERLELEPVLLDEHYEFILSVIRQHSRSMARDPRTYAGMGEEARRRVILDALNTHYMGAGAAEAFNFGGKTDMFLSHEGRSLFVAECKLWSGARAFTATLDQLFGYQAWLDTKLAILVFVRQQALTTIIERAHAALEAHPQFVAWQTAACETELRATVSWRGDERRHADLTVFFISTPA